MNKVKEMLEKYKHTHKKITIISDNPEDQEPADEYAAYLNHIHNEIVKEKNAAIAKIIYENTKITLDYRSHKAKG